MGIFFTTRKKTKKSYGNFDLFQCENLELN